MPSVQRECGYKARMWLREGFQEIPMIAGNSVVLHFRSLQSFLGTGTLQLHDSFILFLRHVVGIVIRCTKPSFVQLLILFKLDFMDCRAQILHYPVIPKLHSG